MTRARWLAASAALALLACGEDQVTPLKAELAKLKKERVPQEQVDTAKREAAESEGTRDAAVALAGQDEAALAESRAEVERLRAALQHETDRNAELRADIDAHVDATNAVATAVDALEARATERRRQLDVLRDQARALAKAMRPDDPAWAEQRRLAVVHDFARDASAQLPGDPAVRALASAAGAAQPDPAALVKSLQAAADAIDRAAREGEAPVAAK